MNIRKKELYLEVLLLLFCLVFYVRDSAKISTAGADNTYEADLIIYGGTSAAITSAVQAVRMDKSVLVVSPDKHLRERGN